MRLVASDIDGTILGHDGRISERTVQAFAACREAGIHIVFVTGRPPRWLFPLEEQLGHAGTVICSNGAVVYDLADHTVKLSHAVPADVVLEARDIIASLAPRASFAAETVEGFHLEPGFLEPGAGLLEEVVPMPLAESLQGNKAGVVKFLAKESDSSPDDFLSRIKPAVDHLLSVTHSAPKVALLEMALPHVNKAATLSEYAATLGIEAVDVVAFGDMPNDIQMLRWAGHGYAMASGHPAALAAANLQAPAFEDDGVARILEQLLAKV